MDNEQNRDREQPREQWERPTTKTIAALAARCAALWKNIEEAATEYRKARNDGDRIDAADKMMNVVYGLLGVSDG